MLAPPLDPDLTSWIVSLRPPKAAVNPWEPYGCFSEEERSSSGRIVRSAGILLTNKECPWHCLMCDLWKHTLAHTVPPGAIAAQIDFALARLGHNFSQIKLYNSGSFFDPAAIPQAEYPVIAHRIGFAEHVIVEDHPRLIGERVLRFRDLLEGTLEVAMGLETVHPHVLPRLNKRFTLEHFAKGVGFLCQHQIQVRAFVLVKPPFLDEKEAVDWSVRSARFAFECGAGVVSLIPTRPGNGALDALMRSGQFAPPPLSVLEEVVDRCLDLRAGRVFADTWDLEQFSTCRSCFTQRQQRLQEINLSQTSAARIKCSACCG